MIRKTSIQFKNLSGAGFTLMELMIVIAILAIVAAIFILNLRSISEEAKDAVAKTDLRTLKSAIVVYESRHQSFPPQADWETYLKNDEPRVIDRVPLDPFSPTDNKYIYQLNTDDPKDRTYLILSVGPNGQLDTSVSYDRVDMTGDKDDIIVTNAATIND